MATATINGVRVFYEVTGQGTVPVVLVHGSWVSHRNWEFLVPQLAPHFRVAVYDRRGHSASERPSTPGSVREDVEDLARLIQNLALVPAFVVGNSFGGSIVLRLAAARPDLLRGVVAHEPPLFQLLASDPHHGPMLEEIGRRAAAVVQRIAAGDHEGAARQFAETVALGPGSWAQLPPQNQRTMIENASTFLDETRDPEALTIDVDALRRIDRPVLLTVGDQSPPAFAPVIRTVAEAVPGAAVVALAGVGHIPQVTHPALYAETLTAFIRRHAGS